MKRQLFNALYTLLLLAMPAGMAAAERYSVAGLYCLENSGRVVYNFNQGWLFCLGEAEGAEAVGYDDSHWTAVNTPHSPLLVPSEGSGGKNYQGVVWYRKHFTMPKDLEQKHSILYFEAVMGKQRVYVNGQLVEEHLGGYLPIEIDLTQCGVKPGDDVFVAVRADNSDDKTYPPGKKQAQLDFCYHPGIYRDVWLIGKSRYAITDAVARGKTAGGGVFVHYGKVSEQAAEMFVDVEVGLPGLDTSPTPQSPFRSYKNAVSQQNSPAPLLVSAVVKDDKGAVVAKTQQSVKVKDFATARLSTKIKQPKLWSPESPFLYNIEITVSEKGKPLDGGVVRSGIRTFEFKGAEGFWLNGKPYRQLIGGNRHQDFAYVGNAVPNSQQWRDARRLKDAGMNIIRVAHYPQDDAFMDACDELGIFVIVATPGWQYWNKDPNFATLVHQNTRDIIRRDRNHPSVLLWEPILNETRYPEDFALEALKITRDEYPFPHRPLAAADMHSAGVKDNYDVLYGWTTDIGKEGTPKDKCIFTREFGEMVDDWYAHNNLNRTARAWGERPQLLQALCLGETYNEMLTGIPVPHQQQNGAAAQLCTLNSALCTKEDSALCTLHSALPKQFIGGAQWHPFDHQRGYHPDTYYGGLYDAFRQEKYSLQMFRAMDKDAEPMLFIANEMTQFSDEDVTVLSNCDSVRLTLFEGDKVLTKAHDANAPGVFTFPKFWNFWQARNYSYFQKDWKKVSLLAEGFRDGKVVCSEKKMPSRRSTKLRLRIDDRGKALEADGSDFVVVIAEVTDDNGNVRRLAMDHIAFEVQGEGRLIGDGDDIGANPRKAEWGSAPALIQSTTRAGKITVIARAWKDNAAYALTPDTLVIETTAPALPALGSNKNLTETRGQKPSGRPLNRQSAISEAERQKMLEEVNKQQMEFGIGQ